MSKLDDFKAFIHANPIFIDYIKNNKYTWQDLYDIYDLYGEDDNIWKKYLDNNINNKESKSTSLEDIIKLVKNIDIDKVQNSVKSMQKAVSLFSDMVSKKDDNNEYTPRPIYKRFQD